MEHWLQQSRYNDFIFLFSLQFQTFCISENPSEGISVEFVLTRRLVSEIMTTYFPTTFLIIISYISAYFEDSFFQAKVVVNLTAMLVLATMYSSASNNLPR